MRIGQGFDVHAFADGRKLIIGGVEIAHARGLLGHSDADVLLHAICDELLGAAGLGDMASITRTARRSMPTSTAASCCAAPPAS